jgi:periplasmic divalent cation tolerance protein
MTPMIRAALVYVTASDRNQALAIGKALVTERLAACANVLEGMTSLYHWQGKLCQEGEAVLILKTRQELVDRIIARVRELHTYDCPCVVSWLITAGNPAYLDWIGRESGGEQEMLV